MHPHDFKDDEDYPVEASWHGNNMHSFFCNVRQRFEGYSICLRRHDARRDKVPPERIGKDCVRAIDKGECPALQMRAEEIKEGKAIYFINREKYLKARDGELAVHRIAPFKNPFDQPVSRPAPVEVEVGENGKAVARRYTPPTRPKVATANPVRDDENMYAAAINAAMQDEPEPAKDETPKKGMSLMELAKSRLGPRKESV